MPELLTVPPVIESRYRALPRPSPEQWGLAIGAWGDCLCCYGNFRQYVGNGGIIYYGTDPGIADFLRRQQGVEEVRFVQADSLEELNATVHALTETPIDRTWAGLAKRAGVALSAVVPTHLEYSEMVGRPITRWHGAKLGRQNHGRAHTIQHLPEPFVLFQPYSLRLQDASDHWPHWEFALQFLLDYTPYHVVVVGQGWELQGEHPRLTNLIGCTSSMEELFALAERADAIVTTSNALGVHAVIQGLPAVLCANKPFRRENYFYRYCDTEPVSIVDYGADVATFCQTMAIRYRL